jgi:hypothetical protein
MESKVPGGLEAVKSHLSPAYAEFFDQLFVASGWYDILPILVVAEAAATAMDVDKMEYVRRSAVFHAERDMNGVYKNLLNAATPVAICRRFASVQQQIYDFGKVQIVSEEPNRVESFATGIPEPLAWWWKRASEHYMSPVLKGAGARDPRMVWSSSQVDGAVDRIPLLRISSHTTWG